MKPSFFTGVYDAQILFVGMAFGIHSVRFT